MTYTPSPDNIVTIGTTSVKILDEVNKGIKRSQIIIYNSSAAAVATIVKKNGPAVANSGIIINPKGSYVESTDGGYKCYQGPISAIGDVAGTLSVVESFEEQ